VWLPGLQTCNASQFRSHLQFLSILSAPLAYRPRVTNVSPQTSVLYLLITPVLSDIGGNLFVQEILGIITFRVLTTEDSVISQWTSSYWLFKLFTFYYFLDVVEWFAFSEKSVNWATIAVQCTCYHRAAVWGLDASSQSERFSGLRIESVLYIYICLTVNWSLAVIKVCWFFLFH